MKVIPCVKGRLKGNRNKFIYRALEFIYLDTSSINAKCVYIMSVFFYRRVQRSFLKKNRKEKDAYIRIQRYSLYFWDNDEGRWLKTFKTHGIY